MGKKEQKKLGGLLSPAPFLALFLVHLVHFSGLNERERKRHYAGSRFVHFFGKQPLCCSVSCCTMATKKDALYLSVNVFSTKVLVGDTIFYVSNWRRDRHFPWSSEPREGLAACTAKGVTSLLSYFKTLSIGPALARESNPRPPALQLGLIIWHLDTLYTES